ncbi:MAG: undecaprenyldiphospho-muramoylpentapeptide beta-N-acetylglucosaminyltransferase [Candidatus Taylorbacteria bacterium RIFOXYD2_FULL_36_9]|uniref:UDP-N-acetylglucosamine--N-acetylmuramyl-(pentapeptide) pyrophosphoryl-undecaprenol N-acetylglucosamine transferase n=1 Tax=Candidatus Taylorbacteria bacterium RIFOXYD2_FULL_36_9 TaxID=1802338 RepID=A0A1G2PDW4_9BACT|nr:MAG: undecaprenyldiphospho-muramoylpentapeptide beta-N-acetylglucosaminyltransferase [Candidatus Taylorbacteria bacterium RIFOXYD2_FULL_36_9]
MKILLTGGGSGGHFYPLVAVAEAINKIAKEENLILPEIFFMSDHPYDMESLVENNISFVSIPAGKIRRYFSLANFFDVFKIFLGIIIAFKKVFSLYPDIVFSKGAYVSFPVLLAARLLKIPIIIHESDSVPGRTNLWASKFAKKIAVSYPDTAKYFADQSKVAFTGNPLRKAVLNVNKNGAHEYLNLEKDITTILIIGGSLGAQIINERILDALPKLVEKYQILHQTGKNNFSEVNKTSEVILLNNVNKSRYHSFDYLNDLTLIMAAGAADLIISRAGSTIFEIATWGVPSIVIPITETNGDHQRKNAFAYARSGAASVIEESNLTTNVLIGEIDRILQDQSLREKMSVSAKAFTHPDASLKIAREIINIALTHEK